MQRTQPGPPNVFQPITRQVQNKRIGVLSTADQSQQGSNLTNFIYSLTGIWCEGSEKEDFSAYFYDEMLFILVTEKNNNYLPNGGWEFWRLNGLYRRVCFITEIRCFHFVCRYAFYLFRFPNFIADFVKNSRPSFDLTLVVIGPLLNELRFFWSELVLWLAEKHWVAPVEFVAL